MSAPNPDRSPAPVIELRARRRAVRATSLPRLDAAARTRAASDPYGTAALHTQAATHALLRAQQAADADDLVACDAAIDEARRHLASVGEALGVRAEAPPG